MVSFIVGSIDRDHVVLRVDMRNMRPDQEFAFRKCGNSNSGMMEGDIFGVASLFFQEKQVNEHNAQQKMNGAIQPVFADQLMKPDTEEKHKLKKPEEEIHFWKFIEDIFCNEYEQENINRYQEQTTKINITASRLQHVREGVYQDQHRCSGMQELA